MKNRNLLKLIQRLNKIGDPFFPHHPLQVIYCDAQVKNCDANPPDNAVSGHGKDKILAGFLIFDAGFVTKQFLEVNREADVRLSTQLISRLAIRDALNHSASEDERN